MHRERARTHVLPPPGRCAGFDEDSSFSSSNEIAVGSSLSFSQPAFKSPKAGLNPIFISADGLDYGKIYYYFIILNIL